MDEDGLLRKILIGDLYYAKLWLVCVALRGVSWDKTPFDQRKLAFRAKEAPLHSLDLPHLTRVPRGTPVRGARPSHHGCICWTVLAQGGELVPERSRCLR